MLLHDMAWSQREVGISLLVDILPGNTREIDPADLGNQEPPELNGAIFAPVLALDIHNDRDASPIGNGEKLAVDLDEQTAEAVAGRPRFDRPFGALEELIPQARQARTEGPDRRVVSWRKHIDASRHRRPPVQEMPDRVVHRQALEFHPRRRGAVLVLDAGGETVHLLHPVVGPVGLELHVGVIRVPDHSLVRQPAPGQNILPPGTQAHRAQLARVFVLGKQDRQGPVAHAS